MDLVPGHLVPFGVPALYGLGLAAAARMGRLGLHEAMIALPFVLMYSCCLADFYARDPVRWEKGRFPYISEMLGDVKDPLWTADARCALWCLTALVGVAARLARAREDLQRKRLAPLAQPLLDEGHTPRTRFWLGVYTVTWLGTAITAVWDAHPQRCPLEPVVPFFMNGSWYPLHYATAFSFCLAAIAESYWLSVRPHFDDHRRIGQAVVGYLGLFCLGFVGNSFVEHDTSTGSGADLGIGRFGLPLVEASLFFVHLSFDIYRPVRAPAPTCAHCTPQASSVCAHASPCGFFFRR